MSPEGTAAGTLDSRYAPSSLSPNGTLENSYGPETTAYQNAELAGLEAYHKPFHSTSPGHSEAHGVPNDKTGSPLSAHSTIINQSYQPYLPHGEQYTQASVLREEKPRCTKGRRENKFGMIILCVVAGIVLLAIGLGVGLGVGLQRKHSSMPPPSPAGSAASDTSSISILSGKPTSTSISSAATATATASGPVTSGTTGIAANSCTFTSPQAYKAPNNTSFIEHCFTDWPKGDSTPDGGIVHDLKEVTVYTFEACMDACVSYNGKLSSGDTKCAAVTYNANLTLALTSHTGNCYLKDAMGVDVPAAVNAASAAISS